MVNIRAYVNLRCGINVINQCQYRIYKAAIMYGIDSYVQRVYMQWMYTS